MGNSDLHRAKRAKNDRFYTQFSDIERECVRYGPHFQGKTVFCNCDDPDTGNFWRFFHLSFRFLGLRKLIAVSFAPTEPFHAGGASKIEYEGGNDGDCTAGKKTRLKGNGDFRSAECAALLEEADIAVTNPPFSLFREYVSLLASRDKRFLIIGSLNAVTYKEVFTLLKENRVWLGHGFAGGDAFFESAAGALIRFRNVQWYTNLDHPKRREEIPLSRRYTPEEYPRYDNCDAIEVRKVADIPKDYHGVMGVPITFLHRYNPEQFEIVRFRKGDDGKDLSVNGKYPYFRILITPRRRP